MSDWQIDDLALCVAFDPETGLLRWKERPLRFFADERSCRSWNTKNAGRPAFVKRHADGYLSGKLFSRTVQAHQLGWMLAHGNIPDGMVIDHINGDPADNRLANLRVVRQADNVRNARRCDRNKSGHTGVRVTGSGKWQAEIKVDGKSTYLGSFDRIEDAVKARRAANIKHGYHENHGRIPPLTGGQRRQAVEDMRATELVR